MQREAQQFVESNVRPLQQQINLGNQQLATREVEITERDTRIALLEHELAEARRQHNLAVASPGSSFPPFRVLPSWTYLRIFPKKIRVKG